MTKLPAVVKKIMRRIPRFIYISAGGACITSVSLFFTGERDAAMVYSESLSISALFCLAAAWFSYLKRDGVYFFTAEFWQGTSQAKRKDRVPAIGAPPYNPAMDEHDDVKPHSDKPCPEMLRKRSVQFSKDMVYSTITLFACSLIFQLCGRTAL